MKIFACYTNFVLAVRAVNSLGRRGVGGEEFSEGGPKHDKKYNRFKFRPTHFSRVVKIFLGSNLPALLSQLRARL